MARRGHKKSRLGCAECKRRHLKCDETKPSCVNCKTAGNRCSFEENPPNPSIPTSQQPGKGGTNGSIGGHTAETQSSGVSPIPLAVRATSAELDFNTPITLPIIRTPQRDVQPGLNLDHLELLHNFQSRTFRSFVTDPEGFMKTAIKYGLQHPFVMYEVLAISSLHLSDFRPDRGEFYRRQSVELQALAVMEFNDVMMDISESNCVAYFVFSSLMGVHAFAESFMSFSRDTDFDTILNRYTESMKLIQGVLVVMDGFWEVIHQSELKAMLQRGGYSHVEVNEYEECKPLREMLEAADLSDTSRTMYDEAILELQRAFYAKIYFDATGHFTFTALTWLVRMSKEFLKSLQERRPEALVILSYHAVLLHRKRDDWSVQAAGRFIIMAIKAHLGAHWLQWLEWPLSVIAEDHQSFTATPSSASFKSSASMQEENT